MERGPETMARRWIPWAILVLTTSAFFALRPLVVSGDGVGYIKRLVSPERDIVPGHLLYVPLLEWLRRVLVPDGGHGDAAAIATFVSALGGGAACALLAWLVARLTRRWWAGVLAASGLAVSYGVYRASTDVEAYSTAVAVMLGAACVLVPDDGGRRAAWRPVAAGALLGVATLLHTSLVLFTPFVVAAAWVAGRSWKSGAAAVAVGGALSAACFGLVARLGLGLGVSGTMSWILTADNGYAQPPSLSATYVATNLGRLFYGLGRTFVHSPAPDRLGVETSVRLSSVGISYFVTFLVITTLALRACPRDVRRRLAVLWAWVIPLLAFGFVFYPAATERWVFVAPCLWLALAVGLAHVRRRWLVAVAAAALIGLPLAANVVTVGLERGLDRRTLARSAAVTALLEEGDLLLYPGHTWDEYIGFYEDAPVERFILASFAGEEQGDREAFLARLRERLEATFARGGRVVAVRVLDGPDSHHGWSLLAALGIPRDDVLEVLVDYEATRIAERPVPVWRLEPRRPAGGSLAATSR